ncbi:hypothetical protein [Rhizobium leguminosarum]|uniref:hypothetical protein n=1 Tax=Rhizobium leguminosarum TaxID=384 RepID=UPI001FEFA3FF|nr:hypothetical protein [Rhizobium leguminosarum]
MKRRLLLPLRPGSDGLPWQCGSIFAHWASVSSSFSMPGRKVDWMRMNENVCLQIYQRGTGKGWTSVVVDGRFEEFPDTHLWRSERLHAWTLLQMYRLVGNRRVEAADAANGLGV